MIAVTAWARSSACLGVSAWMLLISCPAEALAAEAQPASCEKIRSQIGVVPQADADFLRTLAARKDCGFTAQEVYRAAHGDGPWPRNEARERRPNRDDNDSHHDDD